MKLPAPIDTAPATRPPLPVRTPLDGWALIDPVTVARGGGAGDAAHAVRRAGVEAGAAGLAEGAPRPGGGGCPVARVDPAAVGGVDAPHAAGHAVQERAEGVGRERPAVGRRDGA